MKCCICLWNVIHAVYLPSAPILTLTWVFAFILKSNALTCCTQADDGTDEFLAGPQRVVKEWERMDVSGVPGTHSIREFPTAFKKHPHLSQRVRKPWTDTAK